MVKKRTNDDVNDDTLIIHRYSVVVTIYDNGGNVVKRFSESFETRKEADKYAKKLRKRHNRDGIISVINVVSNSTRAVVNTVKSKRGRGL